MWDGLCPRITSVHEAFTGRCLGQRVELLSLVYSERGFLFLLIVFVSLWTHRKSHLCLPR